MQDFLNDQSIVDAIDKNNSKSGLNNKWNKLKSTTPFIIILT